MATDKMVTVVLPQMRMYREKPEDRTAIEVGPGEARVPQWVAAAWNLVEKVVTDPEIAAQKKFLADVLAVPGLSKAAIALLQKHFGAEEATEAPDETATTETV